MPFGLKTEYDDGWLGRYQALKSEIKTINVNPAVSWKVTDQFWLGAGANYQHFEATLTNNVNYSAALAQGYGQAAAAGQITPAQAAALSAATAGLDTFAKITGDDSAWGWNVGAMLQLQRRRQQRPRCGTNRPRLSVEDQVQRHRQRRLHQSDDPDPDRPAGARSTRVVGFVSSTINQTRLYNGGVTLDIEMPDSASLSYYQKVNDKWDFLADVTWTGLEHASSSCVIKRSDGTDA